MTLYIIRSRVKDPEQWAREPGHTRCDGMFVEQVTARDLTPRQGASKSVPRENDRLLLLPTRPDLQ